jgi:hypothetical protein
MHLRLTNQPLLLPSNYPDALIIDDELTLGRNRRSKDFGKLVQCQDEISDDVRWKLFLIRQLALIKYREKVENNSIS